jgi:hypothetical protein
MRGSFPRALLAVALSLSVISCHRNPSKDTLGVTSEDAARQTDESAPEPELNAIIVDAVKVRKDPKGGWFGPKLRDAYPKGEDTPIVYCDSGPSIPTGKPISIFYRMQESKPDSSACRQIIAIVEGEGVWAKGRAMTRAQLYQIRKEEVHFVPQVFLPIFSGPGELTAAWRKPKPIGDPCSDSTGAPAEVAARYKGQNCSLIVEYPRAGGMGYAMFVNWQVVGINDTNGDDEGLAPSPAQVINTVEAQYGKKYIIVR